MTIEGRDYNIYVGKEELSLLPALLLPYKKVMIVTDENVAPLYLEGLKRELKDACEIHSHVICAGERSKCVKVYLEIVNDMLDSNFTRSDAVVALGGGVVGDLAGFVSATYMRGIDYFQIPTSLLAMIDSSIGSKTGIDLERGKNLIGSFYSPKAVFIDTNRLMTLPCEQIRAGLGEGVKYACLMGGEAFDMLERGLSDYDDFVRRCVEYKLGVVEGDMREAGLRRLLNLGHTLAHAIEAKKKFEIEHGVAVGMGIYFMAKAANANGELCPCELERVVNLLEKYELLERISEIDVSELFSFLRADKKSYGDGIYAVKLEKIGQCRVEKMSFEQFEDYVRGGCGR